ncbi:ribosomal protein S5 domain 2-type protein [Amylocystis lapponica]|nr:ribosomal protein S5 domain 2-type protein [Amylocystis lapponica]
MAAITVVSSPGKVLLAGGYLVLDPAFSGVVVSTSARFYTAVRDIVDDAHARAGRPIEIRVRSPQFVDATWIYFITFDVFGVRVEQAVNDPETWVSSNKFVHLALQRTLTLALEAQSAGALQNRLSYGLDITIAGDNDFYSQRAQLAARNLPPTLASLSQLPPFTPTGVRLSDVHKTGLGSSAALITSLISGLLLHLNVIPRDSFATEGGTQSASQGRRLAHNLSQYVHCFAQGKVGSGFDVSAAVFGSQLYTRFDPAVLQPLMSEEALISQPILPTVSPSNIAWNYRVEPFKLPPLTRLMLADVDAGSDTPSLVGRVLKWRQESSATATALWDALDKLNQALSKTLLQISELHARDPAAYAKTVKYLSTLQSVQVCVEPPAALSRSHFDDQWLANPNMSESDQQIIEAFCEAHLLSEGVRAKMREMGTLAGVPIEPPEQTELLDACISGAGVIGGGVPGAGGYDAIWLLVFEPLQCSPDDLPSRRVEYVWSKWTGLDVSPLSASESVAKGVRVEDVAAVPGLQTLVDAPW